MIQQTVHRILLVAFVGLKVRTLGVAFGERGRECKKIGLSSQGVTTDTSKRKRTDYLWAQIRTSAIGNRHKHTPIYTHKLCSYSLETFRGVGVLAGNQDSPLNHGFH